MEVSEKVPERKSRILLIDNHKISLDIYRYLLEKKGFEVVAFENGLEALKMFAVCQDFKLVITATSIPSVTGFDVIKYVKDLSSVPVIAIGSIGFLNEKEICLCLGANGYLLKPVDNKSFLELVKSFTGDFSENCVFLPVEKEKELVDI